MASNAKAERQRRPMEHVVGPSAPEIRLLDTGAPRGERNYHYVTMCGIEVYGSFSRPAAQAYYEALRSRAGVGDCASLTAAIERALIQISGGLCYASADAKHSQLRDAQQTLQAALRPDAK